MSGKQSRQTRDDALADALRRIRVLERLIQTVEPTLHGVRATRFATTVNIPASTEVKIDFTAAQWDTDGFWDGGTPKRVTMPFDGKYLVNAHAEIQNFENLKTFTTTIKLNGALSPLYSTDFEPPSSVGIPSLELVGQFEFNAGDYLELVLYQTQTVSGLCTSAELAALFLGA